jgi:UDP:flavonoid glycosyltransferase YjiC (YdhE family)
MRGALRGQAFANPKVVLSAIGTKGDLFPVLALGRELVRRGYACDLLSNDGYRELAQDHGLRFFPVTVPQTNNLVSGRENLDQHVFPSYLPTFQYFQHESTRGSELVVVNLDECSASNPMCERYGLPLCRIVLAPSKFNSVFRPAWPLNEKVHGAMAATYRRYRLPQIYERMEQSPFLLERINSFRSGLGLPPVARVSEINAPITQRLGLFPDWFGAPQPDWPTELKLVGFPLPAMGGSLEAGLEDFLEQHGRPLVFTPGTGVVDVEEFFRDAERCCRELRLPGVFASPHQRTSGVTSRDGIFRSPFVNLQLLLPRSALLVHHGGIGTTARALEAGVPQIIRSAAYDQPDNGSRIAELGVGTFFAPGQYDHERLVRDVERLLSSSEVQEKLAQLSADVQGTNAISRAADALERLTSKQRLAVG